MQNIDISIGVVTPKDAEEILSIYAPYVENTAITFEYTVPKISEFRSRIEKTLERYPYLKAVSDGKIVGYTYAGVFHERQAYDWAVETTVYVKSGCAGQGIGKMLYNSLEKCLGAQGILNLNACIAYPENQDEYLTRNSAEFHKHIGYRTVGEFYKCGYKFNRWYNMVWMEKLIGEHNKYQPAVKKFCDINAAKLLKL